LNNIPKRLKLLTRSVIVKKSRGFQRENKEKTMTVAHLLQNANNLKTSYEASLGTPDVKERLKYESPVFPVGIKGTIREEQYIERMIERDRKLNWA